MALSEAKANMGDGIVHAIGNNGITWPSARALKCSLQWGNERNPRRMLLFMRDCRGQHGGRWGRSQISMVLDALGDTRATMVGTMSKANPRGGANL